MSTNQSMGISPEGWRSVSRVLIVLAAVVAVVGFLRPWIWLDSEDSMDDVILGNDLMFTGLMIGIMGLNLPKSDDKRKYLLRFCLPVSMIYVAIIFVSLIVF